MLTTQKTRATKILSLYSIKNLIKSKILILSFISTFLLISCSNSKEDQAYLMVQDLYCSSTKAEITDLERKWGIDRDLKTTWPKKSMDRSIFLFWTSLIFKIGKHLVTTLCGRKCEDA